MKDFAVTKLGPWREPKIFCHGSFNVDTFFKKTKLFIDKK